MMWHEAHRARMAAKALARHRKALDRAPIRAKAIDMARNAGRGDIVQRLEALNASR